MGAARRLCACVLVALGLAAGAQDAPKILRVAAFGGDGLTQGEALALQNLVTSYVIDLKLFKVIDSSGQELALREAETAVGLGQSKDLAPLTADYILSGSASRIGSFIVFTMEVTSVRSGEKKSVADAFSTVNDLILAARRLTGTLFQKQPSTTASKLPTQASPPLQAQGGGSMASPSLSLVAGTWKGDKNVDRITILPDGRGFAVLASGLRMALKARIEGGAVLISQDQPNSPDFYRQPGLDFRSAKIVADNARPWRWVFSLSSDGSTLSGVKESVFVSVSEKGAVSVDNEYVRDAIWKRLYR
jgi:hypothetical protein